MVEHLGAYLGILVWLWVASLGVPIPEDIALLTAGYLCYRELAAIELMIPLAMFGVLSGDLFIYAMGRSWGPGLLDHRWARRLVSAERLDGLKKQFLTHQIKTVFVARFLPGMRAMVFLTAGVVHMKVWKFLAVNGTAALISVPFFIALGSIFGHSFDKLKEHVAEAEHVIVFILILGATLWLLYHSYARSAKTREARRLIPDGEEQAACPPRAAGSD